MTKQLVIEDGSQRALKEFADSAVAYLKEHPEEDEVVQLADNITELNNDALTRPDITHPLPAGFQYYFSGFWGQVIGVGRPGLVH